MKGDGDSLTNFIPPSIEESEAVVEIQETLRSSDYKFKDITILRFYRGRGSNKEKAAEAILKYIEWRNVNDVDNIVSQQQTFEVELNARKAIIGDKLDKGNRPVLYVIAGRHNSSDRDINAIRMYIIYLMEETVKRSMPEEERIAICFDLSNFSFACMDYEVVKLLIHLLAYNYPEVLAAAYVINAPFIFTACWAVIKPWIDPRSVAKVKFMTKNKLLDFISEDAIPTDVLPRVPAPPSEGEEGVG